MKTLRYLAVLLFVLPGVVWAHSTGHPPETDGVFQCGDRDGTIVDGGASHTSCDGHQQASMDAFCAVQSGYDPDGVVTTGWSYIGESFGTHTWSREMGCNWTATGVAYHKTTMQGWIHACSDGSPPVAGVCSVAECPFQNGEQFIKSGAGTAPATICTGGCSFGQTAGGAQVQFPGDYIGSYEVTGSCGVDDDPEPDTGLNCLMTSGGTQYCADPTSSSNCGTINGEYVCLDSVPDGNCILTPGGQAICDGGSQTNAPDDNIDDGSAGGVDVFGDGDTGGTAGGTGETSGTDDTTGTGSGDSSNNGDCPAWENCDETNSGTAPTIDDDGCDFTCITAQFYSDVAGGPIISAVSAVSFVSGASACPSPTFNLFGESYVFDGHCSIGDSISGVLAAVFMGVWFLLATRVFLSA